MILEDLINMDTKKKTTERKIWKTPELIILDVQSGTLGSVGSGATDGPFYS